MGSAPSDTSAADNPDYPRGYGESPAGGTVVWYVHGHGRGHASRFRRVAPLMENRVISMGVQAAPPVADVPHVRLPRDDLGGDRDAHARGRLHYAPLGSRAFRRRQATVASALDRLDAAVVVSDVSVEIAMLARLMGIPTCVVRQPGGRGDAAHRVAYDTAELIIAPFPPDWAPADQWSAKTMFLGLTGSPGGRTETARGTVLIVVGQGGSRIDERMAREIARTCPDLRVDVAGLHADPTRNLRFLGIAPDVPERIARAEVVIGGAGLGTVSEVARSCSSFVCVPEHRPFGEQMATADALERRGCAVVVRDPVAVDWDAAIARARRLDHGCWEATATTTSWSQVAERLLAIADIDRGRRSAAAAPAPAAAATGARRGTSGQAG